MIEIIRTQTSNIIEIKVINCQEDRDPTPPAGALALLETDERNLEGFDIGWRSVSYTLPPIQRER